MLCLLCQVIKSSYATSSWPYLIDVLCLECLITVSVLRDVVSFICYMCCGYLVDLCYVVEMFQLADFGFVLSTIAAVEYFVSSSHIICLMCRCNSELLYVK